MILVCLCNKATETWDHHSHVMALRALFTWMFISKFIKLLGHYIRFPVDFLLLPVSILFGYFHGIIKMYAAVTLNVVSSKWCPSSSQLVRIHLTVMFSADCMG